MTVTAISGQPRSHDHTLDDDHPPGCSNTGMLPARPPAHFAQHADLLLALQSLDYAAPTLAQLQRQYDIAQGGLAAEQAGLASLQAQTCATLLCSR